MVAKGPKSLCFLTAKTAPIQQHRLSQVNYRSKARFNLYFHTADPSAALISVFHNSAIWPVTAPGKGT